MAFTSPRVTPSAHNPLKRGALRYITHTHQARRQHGGLFLVMLRQPTIDHSERRVTRRDALGIGRRLDKLSNRPDYLRVVCRLRVITGHRPASRPASALSREPDIDRRPAELHGR